MSTITPEAPLRPPDSDGSMDFVFWEQAQDGTDSGAVSAPGFDLQPDLVD